jgi:hypothetical protein
MLKSRITAENSFRAFFLTRFLKSHVPAQKGIRIALRARIDRFPLLSETARDQFIVA